VDTPSDEVAEKSSSYDLSSFSSGGNSQGAKIIAAAPGDSSMSIGELCPDIDKLDEIPREATSIMCIPDILIRGRLSVSAENASGCYGREGKHALLKDSPGSSKMKSKIHGGCSTKREAAWILSAILGATSMNMRRSFLDR
jgi:hypothetical protein